MKIKFSRFYLVLISILLILSLLTVTSCFDTGPQVSFYDAGSDDLTLTASEFIQHFLYRFDTSESEHSFMLPSAAGIIGILSAPTAGQVSIFGVTADGAYPVTLVGGENVTIKPSASTVAANSTKTIYFTFDDVSSGNEAITIY